MIERMMNQTNLPLLEKSVKFAAARERVLSENIANLSTPDFVPKDLSLERFQNMLRTQETRRGDPAADKDQVDRALQGDNANDNVLFHDRNNRSVEQLMADHASNALMHNMMIELMRKQFAQIQSALKERVT